MSSALLKRIAFALAFWSTFNSQNIVSAKCYRTTKAILKAQLADVNNQIREYVICPGTTLQVGPPTNRKCSNYLWDQYPLMITKPNITIKCGEDGSRHNDCVLTSGRRRAFFLAAAYPQMADWGLFNVSITGSKLQGITFSGPMFSGKSHISTSMLMFLTAPGKDVVVDDCAFVYTETDLGITVGFGSNALFPRELLPTGSQSVVVRNSYFFQNRFWAWLLYNDDQSLTVENSIFDQTTYVGPDPIAGAGSGVLYRSRYGAVSLMTNSCIRNATLAQSLVQNAYDNSEKTENLPQCNFTNVYGDGIVVYRMPSNCPHYGYCPEGYMVGFKDVITDENIMMSCEKVDFQAQTCDATAHTYIPCLSYSSFFGMRICLF